MNFEEYAIFCHSLIWPFSERYSHHFQDMKHDLKKANLKITLVAYVSAALFSSLVTFIVTFPIFLAIFFLFDLISFTTIFVMFIASILLSVSTFYSFLTFAKYKGMERERDLALNLPYAAIHMATIASSGVPPIVVFSSLARFERYGEISKEAKNIVRDTEVFGYDILEAIRNEASATPYKKFREVLMTIVSTIVSGGNLLSYLNGVAREQMAEHRRNLKELTEKLGMYSEIYVVMFVAAPIFFIVIAVTMGIIPTGFSSDPMPIIQLIVYLIIPLLNIGYLLFIDMNFSRMG